MLAKRWIMPEGKEVSPYLLDQDEVTIGRSYACSIQPDTETYPLVSREHAKIRKTSTGVLITDCQSKHGTWVNGQRIDSIAGHYLRNEERIILGMSREGGKPGK
jgi:pSer/pThr/pTyr-binding forkhead associated (FHA) protein